MATLVWSIDDAGGGDTVSVPRTCEFMASRDIVATWFVVPKSGGQHMSEEWKSALRAACDGGHDLQLHGLTHEDCYEFGPPAWPATTIQPSLQSQFEVNRDDLLARYTADALGSRIVEGMEIFQRQLDVVPSCFRAPCGAISKAMFAALAAAGLRYHSCYYISATGYEHLPHASGVIEQSWTDIIPHRPFRWYSGVVEAPILNEYTWRGAAARETEFIDLARCDLDRAVSLSPIVVLLMHTHGIADNFEYSFRLIDSVVAYAETGGHTFSTFGELAACGAFDAAATVDGPDILAV